MPETGVPETYIPVLLSLQGISEEQFDSLLEATEAFTKPSGAADYLELAEGTGIERSEAALLVQALLSMIVFAESNGYDLDLMIESTSSSEDLDLDDPDAEKLADRIKHLIKHGPIWVLHKSQALSFRHDRLFLDSQVTTDIRPVFGRDVDDGMAAAVLTHTLRIEFIQANKTDYFYVTLDPTDLENILEEITRAISKEKSLADTLQSAGVANLTLGGG